MKTLALLTACFASSQAFGQYTAADAAAAQMAAQNEIASATSEYSTADTSGGSRFYLQGAIGWLNWTPQSMSNGDSAFIAGDYNLSVWNYRYAIGKAQASRRWTADSLRFSQVPAY